MTAHPKKVRTILYERYWRVRSGSKTGSSVRSIGQQYTKNGRTGALAEAATTAAAAAPAIVPREYYTTPLLPAPLCVIPGNPFSHLHTAFAPSILRLGSTVDLSSPRYPRIPH